MVKKYYAVVLDITTSEIRVAPNTIKGREKLKEFVNENSKIYRVGAQNQTEVAKVLSKELGIKLTEVKIKYTKNIPTVCEIEL